MKFNTLNSIKFISLTIFLCLFSESANAQTDIEKNNFWKHVRIGGGFGLSFGDGFFSGTLAPSAIYEFSDEFAFGAGLNGTYNKLNNRYKSTILGGSLIGLYNPLPMLQISSEFEELNVNRKYNSALNINNDNYWSPALFLGVGYRSQNFTIGIRYDVLYNENKSVYADPWAPFVRVFF